jgi:hypothetical protein
MMAEMMKRHSQKQGKCDPKDCPGCPLFSVTTFKGMIVFSATRPVISIEYSVMLNNKLSDYHSEHWKPPDTLLV